MITLATAAPPRPARPLPSAWRLGLLRGGLELRQFFRGRESVVFTLAFPVLLLAIFGSVLDYDMDGGVSFTQYFTAGMVAAGLLSASFQNLAIQIPIERDKGVLKRLSGMPTPHSAYFVGKIVMVAVVAGLTTALLLAVGALAYGVDLPTDPTAWATFAWVFVLGTTACTLCGIAFSSLPRSGRSAPAMVTPVALVAQFVSGVFFQFQSLPEWMQRVAALFPLKWMTQGMRAVFLPDSYAASEPAGGWELGRVALVLTAWTVGGLVLCLSTFRWKSAKDG